MQFSLVWAHNSSKHVENSNKHIIEEIMRQVGYLPELYEIARSEKNFSFFFCYLCAVSAV